MQENKVDNAEDHNRGYCPVCGQKGWDVVCQYCVVCGHDPISEDEDS